MKKFSALLICLLMIITCGLAGCASFSINKVKYYNEVLATIDETKITRFDLLTAYNSYGKSYYVQQQGQSEEQALNSTLDLLIDRELMYQYAMDNGNKFKPTKYQVNESIKEMFNSLDEQMKSYVEKAKEILDIETEETETEESSDATPYKLEDYSYSPRAKVKSKEVGGETQYYIEYIVEDEATVYDKIIPDNYLTDFNSNETINQIKLAYMSHFNKDLALTEKENASTISNKAISLFAKDLISYEYYLRDDNGNEFDKQTQNLITRYFERTFKNQIQSIYLENVRVDYLKNSELSINLLTEEYAYLAEINHNAYDENHEAYKTKMKDIGTDGNSVLYHPTTDTKFGYFIHTLISFDDIKDKLTLIKEIKDEDDYELEYNKLVASINLKARDLTTGLVPEDAESVNIAQIIDEYNEIQTTYTDYEERMSAFVQFMFKYTGDTATLKQGMPYVIGYNPTTYTGETDSNNKLVGTTSAMVNEFTKEAINLMKQEVGSMSTASVSNLDNLCITDYGIHLLFYVGDVNKFDIDYSESNNVYIQPEDIENKSALNLYTKVINPLTNKTYFDMMFDLVYPAGSNEVYTSKNGYTNYEKSLIALSKKDHAVTKNVTKIKATKTSL